LPIVSVIDLLRCPHCSAQLTMIDDERGVRCDQGHRYDLAKQGYLNLMAGPQPANADTAAMVALSINLGAYTIEIVRAGLEAIPKSQIEAGQSLGLSNVQIFRYVIIFPALRLMYPALASQFILLMLATSVVSQISAQDLFQAASIIQSRTFRDFEVYAVVAGVYLALALLFRLLFAGLYTLIFARRAR